LSAATVIIGYLVRYQHLPTITTAEGDTSVDEDDEDDAGVAGAVGVGGVGVGSGAVGSGVAVVVYW
jgi:hypothetical protein